MPSLPPVNQDKFSYICLQSNDKQTRIETMQQDVTLLWIIEAATGLQVMEALSIDG